jgi:hypothetical protein
MECLTGCFYKGLAQVIMAACGAAKRPCLGREGGCKSSSREDGGAKDKKSRDLGKNHFAIYMEV